MGSFESKTANFKWIDRYQLIDTDHNDKLFKLMSRVGESEYIGKEYPCYGDRKAQEIEAAIDKKIFDPCPFLMRLVRVGLKTQTMNCSECKIFCLIFQKPSKSLKQESIYRKFKSQRFSEQEITIILDSCVKALHYLKQMGQYHSKISSSNIYINQDRAIVLGDPWLLSQNNDFNDNMHGNTYPSPEKILFKNGFIKDPDQFLSDLFSLGAVLLQVLNLEHMDIIYQKGYKRVLETKLVQKLNLITSPKLKRKMRMIMSHQPSKRNQILTQLMLNNSKTEKIINQEKKEFKQDYIKSMLITSQVKTVKMSRKDYEPREKTIINRIDTSRNPSDFSSDTIIENKDIKIINFTTYQNPIVSYTTPSKLPRESPLLEPESRSTFTFNKKNQVFEENDGKSISSIAKNQSDSSRDNIQLELFESSKRYADFREKNDKRLPILIKNSGFIESQANSFGQQRAERIIAYNNNFSGVKFEEKSPAILCKNYENNHHCTL